MRCGSGRVLRRSFWRERGGLLGLGVGMGFGGGLRFPC